jgi:hypothetical protein
MYHIPGRHLCLSRQLAGGQLPAEARSSSRAYKKNDKYQSILQWQGSPLQLHREPPCGMKIEIMGG